MTKFNEKFVISVPDSGECEINLKELTKVWKKGFYISQWDGDKGEEFRLVREGKKRILLKMTISSSDAKELIKANSLTKIRSDVFNSGSSWR